MATPGLGKLELSVLIAAARLGPEAYGLGIRKEVSRVRRHDYSVGAIYTTLSRLEQKGLLRAWMTDPTPTRGGRSRRQYELTAEGRRALKRAEEQAARLWRLSPEFGSA